jgi:histidine ammonia-lyase
MILFRINSLCKGNSGVRVELVEALINIFNNKIIPLVPSQGSVGSSGDLAPLSHLALTLIGKGYCKLDGEVLESESALKKCGLSPFVLSAKEGLALINGTQMMSAYMCFTVWESERLAKLADIAGTVSLEALKGTDSAFDEKIQRIRPHKGQINTAYNLRALLKNSGIMKSHRDCGKVQDAYSLRCMPQVHGAVKDTIRYCKEVLEIEINSVTDNPLIFPEDSEYLTGGNFHGEPIAFIADYLAIAMSELANISERRIARLVDGSLSGLPRFLTTEGGLNSGLMIAQYTAASLVSENKVLSHPASVDSIPTSANQEDHNSMGSIAAKKCLDVINNVKNVIAIEFLCACQGIDFLTPLKSSKPIEAARKLIRSRTSHITKDVLLYEYISSVKQVVYDNNFLDTIEKITGELKI